MAFLVHVISVADVACANTPSADTALLALEIDNVFLLEIRHQGKEPIQTINSQQKAIQLVDSQQLQASLEKLIGKLQSRCSRAKGGAERRKIKEGKSKVLLQEGDVLDVAAVKEKLERIEVSTQITS